MTCEHELHEMETASACDGLCPLCLNARVQELLEANNREVARRRAIAREYEGVLNTLAPSKSKWVQHVYRNAKAHYEKKLRGDDV